ncbi:MAG: hypothetical protein WC869_11965 [Phycisphaerae bacterium]
MTDDELRSLLRREVDGATNYLDEVLTEFRLKSLDYYHGEKFGNEVEGRSQVVLTEVADTVDFMMPSLMRIFTATDEYGRFVPRGPEDVAGAQQATDYCGYVINSVNNGFVLLHNWFKDALLFKIGVVKSWWDSSLDTTEESYESLSDAEYEALQADPDIEIIAHEEVPALIDVMQDMMPAPAVHRVTCKRTAETGKIKHDNIPPEEFLLEKRARGDVQSLRFCAHQTEMTISDLVAMGYDRDEVAEYAGREEDEAEETERFKDLGDGIEEDREGVNQPVLVTEAYIRADYDGDGIAELRRVLCVGETLHVLENEPWDRTPFSVLSPILMPHRMIGRSISELVMDIQLIKSTLLRQCLDNLYLNNNATWEAVEGNVNLDDLLNPAPGGVVRVRQPGMVRALAPPVMVGEATPMLDMLDRVKEGRTGITKASAGLDADALQSTTAAAVNATIRAAEGKLEMVARVFAETGVRDLYFNTLHLAQKHVSEQQMIRLRGTFVPVDPRAWANGYDFTVNVGLGSGQTQEKLAALMQIAAKQEMIFQFAGIANPIVTPAQYAATLTKMIEAAGFKDTETYVNRPEMTAQAMQAKAGEQPPPDPKVQAEIQKMQVDAQITAQRMKMEMDLKRQEMAGKLQLQREEMLANIELRKVELESERQLRAAEIALKGDTPSTNLPRAQ